MIDLHRFEPRGLFGCSRTIVERTSSTMDEAHRAAAEGAEHGHLIVADMQEAGRGSHGRTWLSPPGQDLYLSLVCRPSLPPDRLPLVTLATGLGTARCAERVTGARAEVKWPNDVLLSGKKCAGILAESVSTGSMPDAVIVGVGLNVNRSTFPPPLDLEATSLALEAGADALDRALVLASLLEQIEWALDRLCRGESRALVDALSMRLAYRNETVDVDGTRGTLEGLARDGTLLVRTSEGLCTLIAGRLTRPHS